MKSQRILGNLCNIVYEITIPYLSSFGLNGFSYSRVFKDGSRSELWNNSQALCHTFFDKGYLLGLYTPNIYLEKERYVFLPSKVQGLKNLEIKKNYELQLHDQREIFNHDNCFVIVRKHDIICEYFIFYSSKERSDTLSFYLNEKEKLDFFCDYFIENAKKIIAIADLNKIKINNENNKIKNYHDSFCDYFNNKNYHLTKRQKQIALLILSGKTACESARILGISNRTVEYYIEILKNKFSCNKKFELAAILSKHIEFKC